MPMPVVNGAPLQCSFGLAPGALVVLPANRVLVENQPAANIGDSKPLLNIMPFGLCSSIANPVTAAQTAAALGVLTPGACIPATGTPWVPGAPQTMIGGMPALTDASMCMCSYGGVIKVNFGGAPKEQVA